VNCSSRRGIVTVTRRTTGSITTRASVSSDSEFSPTLCTHLLSNLQRCQDLLFSICTPVFSNQSFQFAISGYPNSYSLLPAARSGNFNGKHKGNSEEREVIKKLIIFQKEKGLLIRKTKKWR
jgi:hypothetical protein